MPIYAYRCESCGHAKDVLQKISDPILTLCPACGQATFRKQLTAAGFQLKGSGWYVTDFRGGKSAGREGDGAAEGAGKPADAGAPKGDAATGAPAAPAASDAKTSGSGDAKTSGSGAKGASAPAPSPAPPPAAAPPSGSKPG